MSLPVCPNCGSGLITWLDPVPSGHNGCTACGYVAPVREFHAEKALPTTKGITAAEPDPIVSPIPTRQRRPKPKPSVVKEPPTVTKDYWYLRD